MLNAAFPPLEHFLASFANVGGCSWGQVWVRRLGAGRGFELRHAADWVDETATPAGEAGGGQDRPRGALRDVGLEGLRSVVQYTKDGCYRPLTGAPNLISGWRCELGSPEELRRALDVLYPGSLVDAWALAVGRATPATFEKVAAAQPGRSKIITTLWGRALESVIAAGCSVSACVRCRCWTAEGIGAEPADSGGPGAGKSAIPCLEPCPLFISFARTCAEAEQGSTVQAEFAPDDLATLAAALRHALDHPPEGLREGDVAFPLHPWRVARVLKRYPELAVEVPTQPPTTDE